MSGAALGHVSALRSSVESAPASQSESRGWVGLASDDAPAGTAEPRVEGTNPLEEVGPGLQALDLPALLSLVDGRNPQVALARERIVEAAAAYERAESLWLPSIRAGLNYNKHEEPSRTWPATSSIPAAVPRTAVWEPPPSGAGSPAVPGVSANFHLADAWFQPRIAEHEEFDPLLRITSLSRRWFRSS